MRNTEAEREVRIAIVMYGGTSLAIYMNGIAQEFLQLVRATSPTADLTEALSSTARVYRKLAHVLAGRKLAEIDDEVLQGGPPVRFIVDILSGTSAGGINAVMLAKALARNADLAPLKELWLEQGALDRLINDRRSATPRTPYREPVKALFNSDRMYVELLKAFERLNPADAGREPLVESLDLVVTGTDLSGEPIDIRLADGVAQEYAHKHAFRFRLAGEMADEFMAKHDPLLAFAARATSSLPAVFEPAIAESARALAGKRYRKPTDWKLLFRSLQGDDDAEHEQRSFADGGYLDNKPFGHAIDLLAKSSSSAPVTRKLYYLEPQPQRIDPDAPPKGVPNAFDNSLQVFSLARYETIRADIQRLTERNRLIDRIRTLDAGVLEDLEGRRSRADEASVAGAAEQRAGAADQRQDATDRSPAEPNESVAPIDLDLNELVVKYGPAYGGYHRLRVATTTDALANAIADHAQVPSESDVRRALRFVVRAWRNEHFRRNRTNDFEPESAFLRRFDLQFHRRRARFLLAKVNQLFTFDDQTAGELANLGKKQIRIAGVVADFEHSEHDDVDATWSQQHDLLRISKMMAQRAVFALTAVPEHQEAEDAAGNAADPGDRVHTDRNESVHVALHARSAVAPSASSGVGAVLHDLFQQEDGRFRQHVRDELLVILGQPTEEASERAAAGFYRTREPSILRLAEELEHDVESRIAVAEAALQDLDRLAISGPLASELRHLLHTYWDDYEYFDMVQFPLLEATRVGEELSPVEIHRISPADVRHYGHAFGDDKLKGTTFASFGAFLDRRWREHDIRWGRLDGAERLITSLLGDGDPEVRDRLIVEAHLAILQDEFPADREAVSKLLVYEGSGSHDAAVPSAAPNPGDQPGASTATIDVVVTRANTIRFLQQQAQDLDLDPRESAKNLSRLVRATGRLSDTLSTEANVPNVVRNALGVSSLAGATLVDAAIPKTFWHLLSSYWSNLILLLGVALMLLGLPLPGWPQLQGTLWWGAVLVVIGVGFAMVPSLLWSALSPVGARRNAAGSRWLRWFGRVTLVLTLVLVVVGVTIERSGPGRQAVCSTLALPTSVALGLAPTNADLACILEAADGDVAATPAAQRLAVSSSSIARTRDLTYVALALTVLFAVVLAAMGTVAWSSRSRWIGVLGALLAAATGAAGVWAGVRGLSTLHQLASGSVPDGSWLAFTSALTKITMLLAFATAGAVVATLAARAPRFLLSVRVLTWALVIAAHAAVSLGVLGLALDIPSLLGASIALLIAVLGGVAFLFSVGFIPLGTARAPTA